MTTTTYLLCYQTVDLVQPLTLYSVISAASMGEALRKAEVEKAKYPPADYMRWFIFHGYEVGSVEST